MKRLTKDNLIACNYCEFNRKDGCTKTTLDKCIFVKTYDKLKLYESKEELGKLLDIPCEPGTIVYEVYKFNGDGAWEIDEHPIKLEDIPKMNKTVFLDKKEAELVVHKLEALEIIAAGTIEEKPESHWLLADDGDGVVCPNCGTDFCILTNDTDNFDFCPKCGKKLGKVKENEQ